MLIACTARRPYMIGDNFPIICTVKNQKLDYYDTPILGTIIAEITFDEYIAMHTPDQILPYMTKENAIEQRRSFYIVRVEESESALL